MRAPALASGLILVAACLFQAAFTTADAAEQSARPNILLAIADDQSWLHASAYGARAVQTPAFDRVAREGVLFRNAFAASPGCSPSRASLLTGRHPWQNEQAGTHASSFPSRPGQGRRVGIVRPLQPDPPAPTAGTALAGDLECGGGACGGAASLCPGLLIFAPLRLTTSEERV